MANGNPFTVTPTQEDPHALFLRRVWAEGTGDDGSEFEVSQSGVTLILRGKNAKGEPFCQTLPIEELVKNWMNAATAEPSAADAFAGMDEAVEKFVGEG